MAIKIFESRENLKNKLTQNGFTFSKKGEVALKGKKSDVTIFSVSKN